MFTLSVLIPLLTAGALAGFLAGLFGIGGGLLIVPIVLWLLETQHLGGMHIQHLAIGTSFAVMACTTFSGALAHARRRSVRWDIVCRMAPAMVGGALLGTFIAARIPAHYLQLFFVAFVCAIALQMLCRYRPQTGRHLPGTVGICLSGGVIGLLSSWVGICRCRSCCVATCPCIRQSAPRVHWPGRWRCPAPLVTCSPAGTSPACRQVHSATATCPPLPC